MRRGNEERPGLDAVGNDAVARAMQLVHAVHAHGRGARAFDLRAHLDQQGGQVGDFGLAGAVFHQGFAFGERGRHQQVFGAGDGDLVENDVRAAQALGARVHVAVFGGDVGAQLFQAFDMQIDGTRADGASAGQGNPGFAAARHQRPQHQRRGAHGLHHLPGASTLDAFRACTRRRQFAQTGRAEGRIVLYRHAKRHAQRLQELAGGADVAHRGNVFEDHAADPSAGRRPGTAAPRSSPRSCESLPRNGTPP